MRRCGRRGSSNCAIPKWCEIRTRAPFCIEGDARKCGKRLATVSRGKPFHALNHDIATPGRPLAWRVQRSTLKSGAGAIETPLPAPSSTSGECFVHSFSHQRGPYMQRRNFIRATLAASLAAAGITMALPAQAADTIKVGVLHSLSGKMAISETSLKDVALMTIEEINAKGGVMGKKLEAVVVDPASNWPLFAEKARQLITQDKVAVVFGCWTSVSRK